MEIKVNPTDLEQLGTYTKNLSEKLKENSNEINEIANELSNILHGQSSVVITSRIKSFNGNQIKKLIDYTKVISENITLGSRVYKQEDNEFYEKSKREASKYE